MLDRLLHGVDATVVVSRLLVEVPVSSVVSASISHHFLGVWRSSVGHRLVVVLRVEVPHGRVLGLTSFVGGVGEAAHRPISLRHPLRSLSELPSRGALLHDGIGAS